MPCDTGETAAAVVRIARGGTAPPIVVPANTG